MVILWMALLLLHQGYSLVPVKTVQLGKAATLTCAKTTEISGRVQWYKQSVRGTLKLVVTFYGTTQPVYASEFSQSRFETQIDKNFGNLTIVKTVQEDEGYYHCEKGSWIGTEWSGIYLLVKGNTQRSSNYIVVQKQKESNPVHPGDTTTLECPVFSESENKTCPGDHNVFWFRAGSHPNVIYTDRKRHNEYENRYNTEKRCVYRFSKNVSSFDNGTFYCAVAACGEIISGKGTTLGIQGSTASSQPGSTVIFLLCAVLGIILSVIVVLIYTLKRNNSDRHKALVQQQHFCDQKRQQNKDIWMFSAVVFTMMKADRGEKKDSKVVEKHQIYKAVKAFGLE